MRRMPRLGTAYPDLRTTPVVNSHSAADRPDDWLIMKDTLPGWPRALAAPRPSSAKTVPALRCSSSRPSQTRVAYHGGYRGNRADWGRSTVRCKRGILQVLRSASSSYDFSLMNSSGQRAELSSYRCCRVPYTPAEEWLPSPVRSVELRTSRQAIERRLNAGWVLYGQRMRRRNEQRATNTMGRILQALIEIFPRSSTPHGSHGDMSRRGAGKQ
jgi:hypothetical protein